MDNVIFAGFGRADITPEQYGSMSGYGTERFRSCTYVMDRVMATCVAISDTRDQTVLLCTADIVNAEETSIVKIAREEITAATGVPGDRIMISATHNHAGPALYDWDDPKTADFLRYFGKQIAKAATDAMADRCKAQLLIGSKTVENMTFVRHYLMNDGSYAGSNFGTFKSGIKGHLFPADEQMQLIRFQREGARDILLMNWQSHGTFVGHPEKGIMSGDYIAPLRDHIEGLTGCKFAFFQGAAGNLVPHSRIEEENIVENDHIAYGRCLAEHAVQLLEQLRPVKTGPVQTQQRIYRAEIDHSCDHMAEDAKYVWENYFKLTDHQERVALVKSKGFNSPYQANNIACRAGSGDHTDLEIDAISVGDISFVTAPYEMFCSNGRYVKDNTPFEMTFVLAYCNGRNQYIPDKAGFGYDCYERNACAFYPGIGEDIVETHIRMLKEFKDAEIWQQ